MISVKKYNAFKKIRKYFQRYNFHIHAFVHILIVFLILTRICLFVFSYAGIELHSGWYMGVAKNLAENGSYTSYTNNITDIETGAHRDIWGGMAIQDESGLIHFPTSISVGPGYVLPEALFLKIFGNGWIQYRLWPLLSFGLLIVLLMYFAFRLGGLISSYFLALWFWLLPNVYIGFAFEALSEQTALFYILCSMYLASKCLTDDKRSKTNSVMAGIFMGLSIQTKVISFLAFPAFALVFLIIFLINKKRSSILTIFSFFLLGIFIPIFLFETYRFLEIVNQFSVSTWEINNSDYLFLFKTRGSGWGGFIEGMIQKNSIWSKMTLWTHAALGFENNFNASILLPWLILLGSILPVSYLLDKRKIVLFSFIYLSSIFFLVWFILYAPNPWVRHAWNALVLGMLIFSVLFGLISLIRDKKISTTLYIVCLLFLSVSINYSKLDANFILPEKRIFEWENERKESALQGLPSTSIFPVHPQQEVIDFFKKNILLEDKVYTLGGFLVQEMAALTGHVFYPIERLNAFAMNSDRARSYLIIGPYQRGPFKLVDNDCSDRVVFVNEYYKICELAN